MKKKIIAVLALCAMLTQSAMFTYATEEIADTASDTEATETTAPEATEVPLTESTPEPFVATAETVVAPTNTSISDADYMKGLTVAFLDDIEKITPYTPTVRFEAILLRAPEERLGSAQWFVNGVPQGDYYSSEFKIHHGKLTGMNLTIPFTEEYAETSVTIALEVHLNGQVRRIEKTVAIENPKEYYEQKRIAEVFEKIQPVEIDAVITRNVTGYATKYLDTAIVNLKKDQEVYYIDHYSNSAAYLYLPEEEIFCWVPYYSVSVSNKNYTVFEDFTPEEKEIFVNAKGYTSNTFHLIWINLERQKVNFFKKGEDGKWKLEKAMPCATGANITPTPTGVFTFNARSAGWFNPTYYVKPVLYIHQTRAIAMHSILFNPNGTVSDGTMGTPASHGCVRMMPDDINYLNSELALGSTVVVF